MRTHSIFLISLAFLTPAAPAQQSPGDEAVAYLADYLRIDTSNPPGPTVEAARFLKEILDGAGIETTWYEPVPGSKVNLMARLPASRPSTRKSLLLLHHMDVVPTDPSRWPVDPFGGVTREGYLWGRGAMDMKAHGITHLMTLLQLKRDRVELARDVILLAVADEEIGGGQGAAWMIEHHWDNLDPEYVLDEGGAGFRSLLSEDRLVFGIAVTEKQVLWIRMTAEGTAGHGSQPIEDNANEILVRAIERILSRSRVPGRDPVLDEMVRRVGKFADNKFTRAIQGSTVSLTTLQAGVGEPLKVNVIPSLSTATLDCRLLPGQKPAEFVAHLEQLIDDSRVKLEILYQSTSKATSPRRTPLYAAMENTLRRHYPEAVVTPMIVPFGTDSSEFRALGSIGYGFLPVIVTPDVMGSMHSDSERIPVEGFKQGIQLFYQMIRSFLEEEAG